jgi:hypothetical protein
VAKVRFRISMSLDGFTSGPEQSVDNLAAAHEHPKHRR